jgi:hypothetical protein
MACPAVRTPFIRFIAMRDMSLDAPELGGSPACSGKPFAQMNQPLALVVVRSIGAGHATNR